MSPPSTEKRCNYMGARYYASGKRRFLNEDPVFLSVGSPDLKRKTGLELQKYLENPQAHNSYSYTTNNPLKYVDKDGEWLDTVVDLVAIAYSSYKLGHVIVNGGDVRGEAINFGLDGISTALPGVVGLGTLRRAANVADGLKLSAQDARVLKQLDPQKVQDAKALFEKAGVNYSGHVLVRTVQREADGITPEKVINVLQNGQKYLDVKHNNISYFKDGIRVAVDEKTGKAIIVVAQQSLDSKRYKSLK